MPAEFTAMFSPDGYSPIDGLAQALTDSSCVRSTAADRHGRPHARVMSAAVGRRALLRPCDDADLCAVLDEPFGHRPAET